MDFDLENFDFKPITPGLGFHQDARPEPKEILKQAPVKRERTVSSPYQKLEASTDNFFPSDLESFYANSSKSLQKEATTARITEILPVQAAGASERVAAYILDLSFILSAVTLTGLTMGRILGLNLSEIASRYPNEATPLVLTLFVGYYLIYFSVFEKSTTSTIGKSIFSLRVSALEGEELTLGQLLLRSALSLFNFVSLGLFSYYDLQSKMSRSRVIRR